MPLYVGFELANRRHPWRTACQASWQEGQATQDAYHGRQDCAGVGARPSQHLHAALGAGANLQAGGARLDEGDDWHLQPRPESLHGARESRPMSLPTYVVPGSLTLMVSDSLLPCRSVGGTYEMGGWIASCPFSHSESFRPSVDLVLLIV